MGRGRSFLAADTHPWHRLCCTHCLSGCPCPSAFRQPRNGTNGCAVLLSLFLCVHGLHLWSPFPLFYDLCAMAEAPPSVTRTDTSIHTTSQETDDIQISRRSRPHQAQFEHHRYPNLSAYSARSVHLGVIVRLNAQCPSSRQCTARFLSPSHSVRYALYSDTLAEPELALGFGLSLYWVRSRSATLRGWSPTSSTALRSAFCSVIFIF